jgi:hypothetical protein
VTSMLRLHRNDRHTDLPPTSQANDPQRKCPAANTSRLVGRPGRVVSALPISGEAVRAIRRPRGAYAELDPKLRSCTDCARGRPSLRNGISNTAAIWFRGMPEDRESPHPTRGPRSRLPCRSRTAALCVTRSLSFAPGPRPSQHHLAARINFVATKQVLFAKSIPSVETRFLGLCLRHKESNTQLGEVP